MKIKFKGLGINITVECEDGASCNEAVATFQELTGKAMQGMDFYDGSRKVADLDTPAPEELVAVKSKHASA